jgi:hypothetical protein
MNPKCEHLNEDGTFKGGFDGCVVHMMAECGGGHSEESAKKICGAIAQQLGARRPATGAAVGPPLMARMAVELPEAEDRDFMVLPAGVHECVFSQAGRPVRKAVRITAASAAALQRQLDLVRARGTLKPFFDFDHKDEAASGWPRKFYWAGSGVRAPGVYASAERSQAGREAINGKAYQAFSMVFHVDHSEPAEVVCNPQADLNFGGLVNDPAFKEIAPIEAKRAGGNSSEGVNSPELNKGESMQTAEQENELVTVKAQLAEAQQQLKARRAKDAEEAVEAAVKRGAIPAQNAPLKAKWLKWATESDDMLEALNGIEGNAALRMGSITRRATMAAMVGSGLEAKEGPARIIAAYGALAAKNSAIRELTAAAFERKGGLAREMATLYMREIAPRYREFSDMPLAAADVTSEALGTLSGTLVAQRTLQLFKLAFPVISRIYTDFSDTPAQFNQTEVTRVVVVPTVQEYDATLDDNNRPKGWISVTPPQTTDVPITLDKHVGVPIVFDANTLASTVRRLFDEQAPAASYALAKYFVEKIYALFTLANYNAYAAIRGSYVPAVYASYPMAIGNFARSTLTRIAAILNPNEVPINDRVVLLASDYFEQLATDPSLVTFFAGQVKPEIVTENQLPRLAGFEPIEAPNLNAPAVTPNLVGMALHKAGVVAKTRLSNDYTQALPGSSYGSVTTITDPDIGISVVLVQYVNHTGGYAEWRIQVMLGAAVGDKRGGLCITSQ